MINTPQQHGPFSDCSIHSSSARLTDASPYVLQMLIWLMHGALSLP